MKLSHKILAVACAVCVLLGYAHAYLVKWSVITKTSSILPLDGSKDKNPCEPTPVVELHMWAEEDLLAE